MKRHLAGVVQYWMYGCLPAAALLLVLTPVVAADWSRAHLAVWLLIPVYMIHQAEEWDGDRFRHFINDQVLRGREGMTALAGFVVNVGMVWGGFALCLWGAVRGWPGLGLIPAYVVVVNAVVHLVAALVLRCGNPGLFTALTLFPAFGCFAVWALADVGVVWHLVGIMAAVLGHLAIALTVQRHLRRVAVQAQS